jgi:hypothetical protein
VYALSDVVFLKDATHYHYLDVYEQTSKCQGSGASSISGVHAPADSQWQHPLASKISDQHGTSPGNSYILSTARVTKRLIVACISALKKQPHAATKFIASFI